MRYHAILLVFVTTVGGCSYLPRVYMAESVHGRVIDDDTEKPISGAIVFIFWKQSGGILYEDTTGYLDIDEAITDTNGEYRFPSWGPRLTFNGYISDSNPFILFYRRGYGLFIGQNTKFRPDNSFTMRSDFTGEAIRLERFSGSLQDYARELSAVNIDDITTRDCNWEKVPIYAAELVKLQKMFLQNGIVTDLPLLRNYTRDACNDPEEILGEYLDD